MTTVRNASYRRCLLVAGTLVVLAGCGSEPARRPATGAAPVTVGILAVGDTGYGYDFLDSDDYAAGESVADYLARERAEWLEDRRPPADFAAPPPHQLPNNGGVVAASGLGPVARAMQAYCAGRACDFATLHGDNIYPDGLTLGADGRSDADRLRLLMAEPLGPLANRNDQFRIYAALGNHDWRTSRGGALAQVAWLERTPPFYMQGTHYRVVPPNSGGLVELFVIDTTLLLGTQVVREVLVTEDGTEQRLDEFEDNPKGVLPLAPGEGQQVAWLADALASSTARWKIVMGHHPLWSSGGSKSEQARVLRSLLLPALCRDADLYLAGHDHTVELHLDDCREAGGAARPLLQVVSGAGAKQRPVHQPFAARQVLDNPQLTSLWARGLMWGFVHLTVGPDQAQVRVISTANDSGGVPVEEFVYDYPRRTR